MTESVSGFLSSHGITPGTIKSMKKNKAESFIAFLSKRIQFSNKNCIDVGCRSGENSWEIQKAGAIVTAIDPDDSEFSTAKALGIKEEQLTKLSLEDYVTSYPYRKFDMATVFLWNIFRNEEEKFAKALTQIIKPCGSVIISIHEKKKVTPIVRDLMTKFFQSVTIQDGYEDDIVICRSPIYQIYQIKLPNIEDLD